jgi:hypothetical protein
LNLCAEIITVSDLRDILTRKRHIAAITMSKKKTNDVLIVSFVRRLESVSGPTTVRKYGKFRRKIR